MIYHLCHLYFWKVVKMDKMKNHPTRVSTNQSPPLYVMNLPDLQIFHFLRKVIVYFVHLVYLVYSTKKCPNFYRKRLDMMHKP